MKPETLLSKAEFNFRDALNTWIYSHGDELELNHIGYWLQQSAELCIKHCMEISGIKYPKSHDIEKLLEVAGDSVKYSNQFLDYAPVITLWESQTRYIKNYHLAERSILNGFSLVRELLLMNGSKPEDLELSKAPLRKSPWETLEESKHRVTENMKSF